MEFLLEQSKVFLVKSLQFLRVNDRNWFKIFEKKKQVEVIKLINIYF